VGAENQTRVPLVLITKQGCFDDMVVVSLLFLSHTRGKRYKLLMIVVSFGILIDRFE
jgi:hypothetical protein